MNDKRSILVVDDEPGMLETMADILNATGYRAAMIADSSKAIDLVQKVHFDIVLLDIVMPEMNGVDAYYRIRDISPDTKVVMMTGYGSEHPLVKEAIGSGVDDLLHKPFDLGELLASLTKVFVK